MLDFDYDLMVLGNTPTARYGAKLAAQQGLRVGLLTQKQASSWLAAYTVLWRQAHLHSEQVKARLTVVQAPLEDVELAIAGVDLLDQAAIFEAGSRLQLRTHDQVLTARHYLLATGVRVQSPLEPQGLTLDQLPLHWDDLPDQLLIAGGTPQAIAIAQILQQQGKQVTLTCRDRFLPQEEPTLTRRLQASLEADGMEIYTHAPSLQLQEIDGQQWLQAGHHALVSDRVIWAEPTVPDDAGLNLATLGILDGQRLPVNAHLRTAHPQLYACGAVLGGYDLLAIHRQEVARVVANLTRSRPRSMTYDSFAWCFPTEPPFARVGLTWAQARSRFGEAVQLHTFHRGTHTQTVLTGNLPGWGCFVTHPQGHLIGASLWFSGAEELIQAMAVAIAQKLTIPQLPLDIELMPKT